MPAKKILGLIFGGRSAEHEVSIRSAKNVLAAIDQDKYDVLLVGISREGDWVHFSQEEFLERDDDLFKNVLLERLVIPYSRNAQFFFKIGHEDRMADIVFPVLHGPFGEDGTIQGLCKMYNVPFVGPDVLGSAVAMDKDVAKRLFRDAGLPIADFLVFCDQDQDTITFDDLAKKIGIPFFIKPANLGSSVGISKVNNEKELKEAVDLAFSYDTKIIVEKYVKGKEIEYSVLGNEELVVSEPGEIIPQHEFYSYNAKYHDENGAKMTIPAKIPSDVTVRMQELAAKAFRVLECEGMARVDFFLTDDNEIYINEINTIPGFTSISMYPKLLEESGISYKELITRVIELAIARHERDSQLKNNQ
jgi:D-alanine-D-alanine ligase